MGELKVEDVLKALSTVMEPDMGKDIVSLDLVSDIIINDKIISFVVSTKNAAMHSRKRMQEACQFAIERNIGPGFNTEVEVKGLKKAQSAQKVLPNIKNIIAVVSGKGGVGKSTVASNIAIGLNKKGLKVGVVDADIYGPSMPIMFDCQHYRPMSRQIENKQYIVPAENYGIKLLSIGFFAELDEAVVWRGPMAAKALHQLFFDADWGELDYLIIDTPPGTGDVHLSIVQTLPLTGVVVVTTPQNVAIADAKKSISMFNIETIKVPILGIVENMSWFTPKELPDNKYYIFGDSGGKNLSDSFNIPLLGQIPLVQSVRESGDAGRPAIMQHETVVQKYYLDLCDNLINRVDWRNDELSDTKVVEVDYGSPKCSS